MGRLTAQRKRRGRKPGTILRELAAYKKTLPCGCMRVWGKDKHDDTMQGCVRTGFGRRIAELRAALKGAKT